jgi:uncharacterized membrane protein
VPSFAEPTSVLYSFLGSLVRFMASILMFAAGVALALWVSEHTANQFQRATVWIAALAAATVTCFALWRGH